jgi:tetratricopeptide (TPR) repeat protein
VIDFFRRDNEDPVHPGLPVDTPERWDAAEIMRANATDPAGWGGLEVPAASRAQLATSRNFTVLTCWAGEFRRALPLATAEAELSLTRGQTTRAARCFTTMAFCQLSLGQLTDGRASIEQAERLMAPTAAPFGTRHARENLTLYVDDHDALAAVVETFTNVMPQIRSSQAWALGPSAAILARAAARLGRSEEALEYLDRLVPWLERAPAWAVHFPCMAGHAAETLWLLRRLDHADVVERALRDKVLVSDFRDIAVDARLSLARLCALTGRYDEARRWFAAARTVLTEQAARPLLAICDYDEALMHLRRHEPGDVDLARSLLMVARHQFQDLAMTGWLRRAEELSLGSK